ncbi:MAG: HdeD family acid-resistance protein [Acutalibacteraceae bacterium]|nr:DUF308 domain-containing protein [Oscillospiraceae bacterium]
MKKRSAAPIRITKIGYIVMSIVMCVIGVLFIVLPQGSMRALGIICGISAILFGLIKIVGYGSGDLFRLAFQYDLEFGIVLVILGAIILINPQNLINFMCIAMGISFMTDGLFKIRIAHDSKVSGIPEWWAIAFFAVISCVAGAFLAFRPASSAVILSYMLGVSFIIEGILNFAVVLITVRIAKNQKPDIIEVEYENNDE